MKVEPSRRDFLRLAFPNVLTNLTVPVAGLVDLALLGHLDEIAPLAGVALAGLIFDYVYLGFGFLRMGTTGLTANALGADDREASAGVFFRSIAVALVLGVAILLARTQIGTFGFWLLQGEPEVLDQGRAYFHARIWGAPATLCGYVITGWLLGRHRPKRALVFSVFLNGMNILLDWLFIYRFGMGARGAGLATMISETAALFLGFFLVWGCWSGHPRFHRRFLTHKEKFMALLTLQRDILIRTFCLITTFSLFTNLSGGFGTVVLAANSILLRFLGSAAYLIDGYAFALESLAGKYAGARNIPGVRRSLTLAIGWNVATVLVVIVAFLLAGRGLIGFFTIHPAVVGQAVVYLPQLCLTLMLSGFAYIYDGFFIGLVKGRVLRRAMILSTLFGFLPLAAGAVLFEKPVLLWWAMIVFMALRVLTLGSQSRYLFHSDSK